MKFWFPYDEYKIGEENSVNHGDQYEKNVNQDDKNYISGEINNSNIILS